MYINKGKATSNVAILDKLFLINDLIYFTEPIHMMNGKFDYATKVFDQNKNYLGMIRSSKFPEQAFSILKNET